MELVTSENIFNDKYILNNRTVNLNGLIKFALQNKYIDEEYAQMILEAYQNAIYSQILENYEFDLEDDYEIQLRELSTKFYMALNEYLVSLNSPYVALNEIVKSNPKVLINNAYEKFKYIESHLREKIFNLKEKSKLLIQYNFEYGFTIDTMQKRLKTAGEITLLYPTVNGNCHKDVYSLTELDKIVDKLIIESDILNKFDQNELVKLLSSAALGHTYNNIAATALYNYLFNNFFKDSSSIILSDKMRESIINGIQNGFFDIEDIETVINSENIKFNELEKKYINDNFISVFNETIIENKDYHQFVKIK